MTTMEPVDRFRRVLGDELRQARKRCGWTRKHLRERLATVTPVSEQTLATYELGTRGLAVERLVELCDVLKISASELIATAIQRTTVPELADAILIDLRAVVRDRNPALSPLRRWAQCRLSATPDGLPTVVHLDQVAFERMAELCGMTISDLATALRGFRRLGRPAR